MDKAQAQAEAQAQAQALDSAFHANVAGFTGGLSPISLALAGTDWALHLATQPAQTWQLLAKAQQGAFQWWLRGLRNGQALQSGPEDLRFTHPGWRQWPLAPIVRAYLGSEAWWREATDLRGMTAHHREMTRVFARQWLDLLSPANAPLLNPEVVQRTWASGGANLLQGTLHAIDDWRRSQGLPALEAPERPYQPGVDVAITPGRVVHRNHLVELIQYSPSTPSVQAEPVFIVPSWIMKYYILDLSPANSMVRWLVGQGHTVFILSWRNPDESDALLDMSDYLHLGLFDALAAIARLVPGQAVHAAGYCLGGTLLAIGAAALARPGSVQGAEWLPRLASLSLLAAETDFSEPGEMGVLIDESQVAMLEDMMAERGYLTGRQMAGSFRFLHARELVWSATLRELWLGERLRPNDLMAWNADTTRMPAAMHSEYLRRCYLRNELAESRYPVQGRAVSLSDITQPIFLVGTEKDHVSPWRSVYKLHRLCDAEISFVLTNGGHNAGIVSEPGHPGRHFALRTRAPGGAWVPPEQWAEQAEQAGRHEGSWWTAWHAWLLARGNGHQVPARTVPEVNGLPAAPGDHVQVRYND
jgi:polyhydroxyalkanoate synthase